MSRFDMKYGMNKCSAMWNSHTHTHRKNVWSIMEGEILDKFSTLAGHLIGVSADRPFSFRRSLATHISGTFSSIPIG